MESFRMIGERLRAHRLELKLSAEDVAKAAGVSRALLQRYEAGQIIKLDVLERLARVYGLSPTALFSLGTEYIVDGIRFFERILKLEESAEQITSVFGPLLYTLSSDSYDQALERTLRDPKNIDPLSPTECSRLLALLTRRKLAFQKRQPSMIHILPSGDIERYLVQGLNGRNDKSYADRAVLRREAIREMEHTGEMIASPPMGVQIALTNVPLPTSGFPIIRSKDRRQLVNSPFRLGEPLNLRYGVATITEDREALEKHEQLAQALWKSALKGGDAAAALKKLLKKYTD